MSSGKQPSRALLIAAGALTQLIGAACLVLALASIPVVADLKTGMSGVIASVVASLAAIVCGTLVWRGRLVPLALAAGLDIGFGIGLPRGGSAIGAMLRILPAGDVQSAESLIVAAAIVMFAAAILCVLAVPSALKLRQWARDEIAHSSTSLPVAGYGGLPPVDETAPTNERQRFDPSRPSAGTTLRGLVPAKLMPTQVLNISPAKRGKPALIIGVAVTLIAIGIIVITAATDSQPGAAAGTGHGSTEVTLAVPGSAGISAAPATAGNLPTAIADGTLVDAAPEQPTVEDFVARLHQAIGTASATDLGLLFDSAAFAFGVEANDLAEGRDAIVAQLRDDLGGPSSVSVKFAHVGQDGTVAWIAEELRAGDKTFVITAVLGLRDGAWTIAALHWAEPMPNATAYRLAREGELAVPDAIPNVNDQSPLAAAMRTAFASKPSFVDARSTRTDAFNFGSASGERLKGGDAIRKIFGRIAATIRLHDAIKVGMIGDRAGWGVANVDFTDADKDGTEETQTFRVLAAWIKEDAGWRIVLTQWSNPR